MNQSSKTITELDILNQKYMFDCESLVRQDRSMSEQEQIMLMFSTISALFIRACATSLSTTKGLDQTLGMIRRNVIDALAEIGDEQ